MTNSSTDSFRLALCQYELTHPTSFDEFLDRVASLLESAGPADIYLLPELITVDATRVRGPSLADQSLTTAEQDQYHAVLRRTANAQDAYVVGGTYTVAEAGRHYNRCPILAPDGSLETTDKQHLTPEERGHGKSASTDPPAVIPARIPFGVGICYDIEFPEFGRHLATNGAELILVPSWTTDAPGMERIRRCAAARAVENQAYVAVAGVVDPNNINPIGAVGTSVVYGPCDSTVDDLGPVGECPSDDHDAHVMELDEDAIQRSRTDATVRPYVDYRNSSENY